MANTARKSLWISPEDYLLSEEAEQIDRHEYVEGEIYLMTGDTLQHNTIAGNLYVALRQHLKGSPCRVQINDVRLFVKAANSYFYPDLFVHCAGAGGQEKNVSEAALVIEVMSPSTARYDRGGKFMRYRLLPSLQEYVLVDTDFQQIEVYRRGEGGDWVFHAYGAADTMELKSIAFGLAVSEVYLDSDVSATEPEWIPTELFKEE